MTAPSVFEHNLPIADQNGSRLIASVMENTSALRNSALTNLTPAWNFVNAGTTFGGTYEEPSHLLWENHITGEWLQAKYTWGPRGPVEIVWKHRSKDPESTWHQLGKETIVWDIDGNLTSTAWSEPDTYPNPFDETLPDKNDYAMKAIDDIRRNFMALQDDLGGMIGHRWNIEVVIGAGTAEEPERYEFINSLNTDEEIRAFFIWSDGAPSRISWDYTEDAGSTRLDIGVQEFVYDSGWTASYSWSAPDPAYNPLDSTAPTGEEPDADDALEIVRNNQRALKHAAVIGSLPGWLYFWSQDPADPGSSTVEQPEAMVYFQIPYAVVSVQNYGTSGFEEDCITRQVLWFSEDAGVTNTPGAGVSYNYVANGIVGSATWDDTQPALVENANVKTTPDGSNPLQGTWDDNQVWADQTIWSDD